MEEKILIIDEICKFHPSLGVKNGWSDYTGGMMDSGSWHFRKMIDVSIVDLKSFLQSLIGAEKQNKINHHKEEQDFIKSGMTHQEWLVKGFNDVIDKTNRKFIEAFIDENPELFKPTS